MKRRGISALIIGAAPWWVALAWLIPQHVAWAQPQRAERAVETPKDPVPTPTEGMEVHTTESGLKYIDLKVGEGEQPGPNADIIAHYSGWLEDGTLFDSSVKRKQPIIFNLNDPIIEGWKEGLGTMRVGGKRKLIVPPELGYGNTARPNIPPNSTLIFEVELIDVSREPMQSSVEGLAENRIDLTMKFWDIVVGTGEKPALGGKAKMHYSIWLKDGKFFDSTKKRGTPVEMPLNRLFPGWLEGMLSMKVGGKRRLELPAPLAYGRGGLPGQIPPNSIIILEVELLDVIPPSTSPDRPKLRPGPP